MITIKDVEKLASLARIHLDEGEKESLAKEIDAILAYVAQINDAGATSALNPNYLRNVMREDNTPHESAVYSEKLLQAAPSREGQYFKVKKILN